MMAERPPSNIPVSTSKRLSMSLNSLHHSTNSISSSVGPGAAASPVTLSQPPPGKKFANGKPKRQSILRLGSRRNSISEMVGTDEPAHLKAQIALLQSSLHASHQRILALTSDLNLDTSTSTSPGRPSGSPLPWTPVNGFQDLLVFDGMTPMSDIGGALLEDVDREAGGNGETGGSDANGHDANGLPKSRIPRLPHSLPSFDLRSNAVTPGKNGTPAIRKASDGPLGLTRIPQAAVAHALSLHDTPLSGTISPGATSRFPDSGISPGPASYENAHLRSPFLGLESPYSPAATSDGRSSPGLAVRRVSGGGSAASTRVIDSLQTDLYNQKGHVERLKQEVRSNQRLIGSLTRQTEDLRETKERMRVECEGLNNVIARKDRLLQEVLERARTAEGSLTQHLSNKKALEDSTKKSLKEMSAQMEDAVAARQKADSEATSLRESVKSLKIVWAREMRTVRDEIVNAEEKGKKDLEDAKQSHSQLLKLVETQSGERDNIKALATESMEHAAKATASMQSRVSGLRSQLDRANEEARQAKDTAMELAGELTRLRRLMREPRRLSLEEASKPDAPSS